MTEPTIDAVRRELKSLDIVAKMTAGLEWITPSGCRERADELPDGVGFFVVNVFFKHRGEMYELAFEIPRSLPNFERNVSIARAQQLAQLLELLRQLKRPKEQ